MLQATADKKNILFKQKYCCPKLMDNRLASSVSLPGPEKYSNLHITVSAFRHSSPVPNLLLVKIAEASAFGRNYISFSPSSATGHEVFLLHVQMKPFVFLSLG